MKLSYIGAVLALCITSCSRNTHLNYDRNITIQNDSTNHLDWAKVDWGGRLLDVGVMPPGKGATYLNFNLPSGVTTNTAFIEFINEDAAGLNWESGSNGEVRERRAHSATRIPVDVSKLLRLGTEHYDITFRILSLTNADVLVNNK